MKKTFLILLMPILLISCHLSNKHINRESDKQDAEKITAELFEFLKQSDFDNASDLFSDRFFEVTTKAELLVIFEGTSKKLGTLNKTELTDWNTTISEGAIDAGIYNLLYNADFEIDKAAINISLEKSENGNIKIIGYTIKSNAFMN